MPPTKFDPLDISLDRVDDEGDERFLFPPGAPPPWAPRMLLWAVLSVVLMGVALWAQHQFQGNVLAVTLYKAHLLSLGGWAGYWLDRALFPYDRPHLYLEGDDGPPEPGGAALMQACSPTFGHAMLRRAIVVAACLVCVGLGA